MLEFAIIIVLIGAMVALAAPWIMRRRGAGANWVSGNLLVTGVSPRPDATGEQFVTITGVINGPTVNEHVVYQQLAIDVDHWPTMGQLFPVVLRTQQSRQVDIRPATGDAVARRAWD